ncbi:hypothetical protein [Amycolatopsis sp. SID8362]|uniref:hypothetical protein n=1 Tax=Amycolatopsis sp. SID8362 TaxID=2690346 RepID=UPI00136B72D3|nr:hypothetical protein [Amycolatopsis sp. SID8362]NBH05686.1 hypothetical protein [Amycolatopsis sp. SID8362]NED42384.1 hypothetical protein [Amycolatopsis sp. SID8362]
MSTRIIARNATYVVEAELGCAIAGVSDEDGESVLLFQCAVAAPDPAETAAGRDKVLHVIFAESALEPLGLAETDFEIVLDTDTAAIDRFRAGLARVFAYGRPDVRPVLSGF